MKRSFSTRMIAALSLAVLWSAISAQEPAPETKKPAAKQTAREMEVCFVLDTTGSMSSLIQGAKDKIWSIANELATLKPAPKIKFGLIAYRDRKDAYVTKVFDLSDDIDAIYDHLMGFKADGGGDTPESVNQALHEAVTKMSWSKGRRVAKLVFLVGDAPPHTDYPDDIQYPEICKLAMKKSLIINTIRCGNMQKTETVWNDIAQRAEGEYVSIAQSGGTIAVATPLDKEIAAVNAQLNGTIVCYGDHKEQAAVRMKVANNAAAKAEAIADRADFYRNLRCATGGLGGKVVGGNNDLVEQIIQNKLTLKDVDAKKLSPEMQKLSREEQLTAIKKNVEERQKLQAKIDELLKKRSVYLAREKARLLAEGKGDSFDLKVKEIVREQSKR